jgi:hypothetical protein
MHRRCALGSCVPNPDERLPEWPTRLHRAWRAFWHRVCTREENSTPYLAPNNDAERLCLNLLALRPSGFCSLPNSTGKRMHPGSSRFCDRDDAGRQLFLHESHALGHRLGLRTVGSGPAPARATARRICARRCACGSCAIGGCPGRWRDAPQMHQPLPVKALCRTAKIPPPHPPAPASALPSKALAGRSRSG